MVFKRKLALVAALGTAVGTLATAQASLAQTTEAPATAVVYSDLDLRTESGVGQLDKRLSRAARIVCGNVSMVPSPAKRLADRCHAETLGRLAPQRTRAIARATDPSRQLAAQGEMTIRVAAAD